jgi:hypothetical protein
MSTARDKGERKYINKYKKVKNNKTTCFAFTFGRVGDRPHSHLPERWHGDHTGWLKYCEAGLPPHLHAVAEGRFQLRCILFEILNENDPPQGHGLTGVVVVLAPSIRDSEIHN